jgi:hypothetical protein
MNIEKYFEDFVMLDWQSVEMPGGGIGWEQSDGARFKAGIAMLSSSELIVAESSGMKSQFRITSKKLLVLEKDDIVRRLKDDKKYRITTNQEDSETPEIAIVQFATCRAERID